MEKLEKIELPIKSISEAYSMQPATISVMSQIHYDQLHTKYQVCKRIELELVVMGNGSTGVADMYFVGYDFDNNKMCQYKADSVNVHYGNPD